MFRRLGSQTALQLSRLCTKLVDVVYRARRWTDFVDSVALELTHRIVLGAISLTNGIDQLLLITNHWYICSLVWLAHLLDRTGGALENLSIDREPFQDDSD